MKRSVGCFSRDGGAGATVFVTKRALRKTNVVTKRDPRQASVIRKRDPCGTARERGGQSAEQQGSQQLRQPGRGGGDGVRQSVCGREGKADLVGCVRTSAHRPASSRDGSQW